MSKTDGNAGMASKPEPVKACELKLCIDNDGGLYARFKRPAISALCHMVARREYSRFDAMNNFYAFVLHGARLYARHYAQNAREWNTIFPPEVREKCALMCAREFEIEYACNQYDGVNPVVKEQRKPLPELPAWGK